MANTAKQDSRLRTGEIEAVRFQIGDKHYSLNVDFIDSIEEIENTTRVPRASKSVNGLVDVRGDIVVLITPSEFLGIDEQEVKGKKKIVLLDETVDNQRIGLIVDKIIGVDEYDKEHFEAITDNDEYDQKSLNDGYIASLVYTHPGSNNGRVVGLLDAEKIVSDSVIEPVEQ